MPLRVHAKADGDHRLAEHIVTEQWLGVQTSGATAWRAYSIASANYADELEFYSIVVPGGAFTSQLAQLKVGDAVLIENQPYGFLTTSRFQLTPPCDLWMLSTGTGLAPFLSILQDPQTWQNYRQLIIVHGVRDANELAYAAEIQALRQHELFGEYSAAQANKLVYLRFTDHQFLHVVATRLAWEHWYKAE